MEFINPILQQYAEAHTSAELSLLQKINRDTHADVLRPRMLSGHLQGRLLSMLSKMIQPENILEIGTYTGYSAICLAEGLAPGGKLVTLDINEELENRVRAYFKAAKLDSIIDYRIGDAVEIIPQLNLRFDLVFIDADKRNYSTYADLVIDKMPGGGYLLADNVLWSGKVIEPDPDKDTQAILDFNKKIVNDPRLECILLPVRDGIMIARKR